MKLFSYFLISLLITAQIIPLKSFAQNQKSELIGQLSISDILIQPRFLIADGMDTDSSSIEKFDLERSYFFFSWEMNKELSAHFGVGQAELLNHNSRLEVNVTNSSDYDKFTFFEAYGQLNSKYGQFRAGLIPLMFGWEGGRRESEWIFPRTLFFGGEDPTYGSQNFALRDYGLSYSVSYNDFYTQAALHNGESRENSADIDSSVWHTGRVGYKNKSGVEVAISMSNGKYQASKVEPEYDFAYGNVFASFEFYNFVLLAEGFLAQQEKSYFEIVGEKLKKDFWDFHVDLSHPLSQNLTGLLRYEQYEPDTTAKFDMKDRYIVGLQLSNELRTSNVFLWGIKNKEQGLDTNNDMLMLVWKVRSLSVF